jgi:hypothetical protein
MINDFEKFDNVLSGLQVADIIPMIYDQIESPGVSVHNYFKAAADQMTKEAREEFSREISFLLEKTFPISFDEESRDDYDLVYQVYRLLVINLISGMTIFLSEYINKYSRKKSFLKTYGDIKPVKSMRNLTKENYIVITNISNIFNDICSEGVDFEEYLKFLIEVSDIIMPSYILDAFLENKLSENGLVSRLYEIIKDENFLDIITTKVLMDYKNNHIKETPVAFNNDADELSDDEDLGEPVNE